MNIYFTGAIYFSDLYGQFYQRIVKTLVEAEYNVTHDHITGKTMKDIGDHSGEKNEDYYKKTQRKISKADIVVAETSFPSTLNIGHEVSLALEKGKPVIALYLKDKSSHFFKGINSEKFQYLEYTPDNLEKVVKDAIQRAVESSDTRFNFYISPEIGRYLDWISLHKKTPRAVFLRSLLEKAMRSDKDFEG